MSTTTQTSAPRGVRPRQPAPELTVVLLRGGTYRLEEQTPDRFTMIVFFRGLHCPVCRAQLSELDRRLDELDSRGIDVIAVSGETRERTTQLAQEWKLERLPLAYGLTEGQMRAWGLYESILSMPVGRPRLDDLLGGIDYWTANDYPARGEA